MKDQLLCPGQKYFQSGRLVGAMVNFDGFNKSIWTLGGYTSFQSTKSISHILSLHENVLFNTQKGSNSVVTFQ